MGDRWSGWTVGPALFACVALSGCTKVYNQLPATTTAPSSTPSSSTTPDTIEFRVFGTIGSALATIKYTDSINGLTVQSGASLPYVARITSTQPEIFLLLDASVPASTLTADGGVIQPATLQVQIVINGTVFREGYATGVDALDATAEGTWRRP